MAVIKIERTQFEPHPEGHHEGVVADFEDLGTREVTYNGKTEEKHQGEIRIESFVSVQENGDPFVVFERVNFSGSRKSKLRRFRESILGRKLVDDEPWNIDTSELIGIGVGFVVTHNVTDGGVFANLDSIWRSNDQSRALAWYGRKNADDVSS